ncbi:nicotianamine synthase family protein [Rossellomorea aquimaris]|uniref:rRNA methyltransferase n=1 Tax=Rossellomorea aquimaris TaxID=189382 RepID=A0A1J6VS13_9BACI|nr:nicotianamine synthase family protein [Rossellomorea aquimaris]OIU68606.1 rRNA methyltransferase [Rossellomorea aquimaris]
MKAIRTFEGELDIFLERFEHTVQSFIQEGTSAGELEQLVDDYSSFILSPEYISRWEQLVAAGVPEIVKKLQKSSALAVAVLEKHRAMKLLKGESGKADYFENIESCIDKEFGRFQVTDESVVLLVGSGAFPMTPLLIAGRTGAKVIGIDIDEDAVTLGRQVVERLGADLDIRIEPKPAEELDKLNEVTHIIFSSTVDGKYKILDSLYEKTGDRVVVSMRYGNGLKSLFNFPSKSVNEEKWIIAENFIRNDQIFDILIYEKAMKGGSR